MNETAMIVAWFTPMVAILGLFWNVAQKLGHIESEVKGLRSENKRLESEVLGLRALVSLIVDARRGTP